jgi:hypothetical protein
MGKASGSSYRIVLQGSGVFDIEVNVIGLRPMTVKNFSSQAAAEIWTESYKSRCGRSEPPIRSITPKKTPQDRASADKLAEFLDGIDID